MAWFFLNRVLWRSANFHPCYHMTIIGQYKRSFVLRHNFFVLIWCYLVKCSFWLTNCWISFGFGQIPLKATPHQVTYFAEKNLYPLIVSVPVSWFFVLPFFRLTIDIICFLNYMFWNFIVTVWWISLDYYIKYNLSNSNFHVSYLYIACLIFRS